MELLKILLCRICIYKRFFEINMKDCITNFKKRLPYITTNMIVLFYRKRTVNRCWHEKIKRLACFTIFPTQCTQHYSTQLFQPSKCLYSQWCIQSIHRPTVKNFWELQLAYCGIPTVADDINLVSGDPFELRAMFQIFTLNQSLISMTKNTIQRIWESWDYHDIRT